MNYPSPISLDHVPPDDYKRISLMTGFDGSVVLIDAKYEFCSLVHYAFHGKL